MAICNMNNAQNSAATTVKVKKHANMEEGIVIGLELTFA